MSRIKMGFFMFHLSPFYGGHNQKKIIIFHKYGDLDLEGFRFLLFRRDGHFEIAMDLPEGESPYEDHVPQSWRFRHHVVPGVDGRMSPSIAIQLELYRPCRHPAAAASSRAGQLQQEMCDPSLCDTIRLLGCFDRDRTFDSPDTQQLRDQQG